MVPTYVNIFIIYSICNVHDCTWGNRPDKLNDDEKERLEEFEEFRAKWVIFWVLCNSAFSYVLTVANRSKEYGQYYFYSVAGLGIAIISIRVIGGVTYVISECFKGSLKQVDQQQRKRPQRRASVKGVGSKRIEGNYSRTDKNTFVNKANPFLIPPGQNEESKNIHSEENRDNFGNGGLGNTENPEYSYDKKKKSKKKSKKRVSIRENYEEPSSVIDSNRNVRQDSIDIEVTSKDDQSSFNGSINNED